MLNSLGSCTNALDADIGLSQINMMFPAARMIGNDYLPGVTDALSGISINNGQLPCDTVDINGGRRKKGRRGMGIYGQICLGIIGLIGAGFALKKGKDGVVKLWKNLMEKLGFAKKSKK